MSDESSVQKSVRGIGNDHSSPRSFVKVDGRELSMLLHRVVAVKNLGVYAQTVAAENKKLRKRNEDLEKIVYKSSKAFGQLLIADRYESKSKEMSQHESEIFSLPSGLDSVKQCVDLSKGFRLTEPHLPKNPVHSSNLSSDTSNLPHNLLLDSIKPTNSGEGISLRADGDPGSVGYISIPSCNIADSKQTRLSPRAASPNQCLSSGFVDHESLSAESLLEAGAADAHVIGVSREYFDVVVKELAKTKLLLRRLLTQKDGNPKEQMTLLQLRQMTESLESENQKLKETNLYFRKLLVSEATTGNPQQPANKEILKYLDKVKKLERQVELKNVALEQLHKQTEIWKDYGKKALTAQYSRKDGQVVSAPMQHVGSQTFQTEVHNDATQTDIEIIGTKPMNLGLPVFTLSQAEAKIVSLESMVGELTVEKQGMQEKIELLSLQNQNLEKSCQQMSENIAELERNQDVAETKELVKGLTQEIEANRKTLKDNQQELKFCRHQVQVSQNEMGTLNQQKLRLEAVLKSEQERAAQKETQLFTQCSKLQQQVNKLQKENEKLHLKLIQSPAVARVQPVMKEMYSEPSSMPLMSAKSIGFPWQQGPKEILVADSDVGYSELHYSNPGLLKYREAEDEDEPYLCHHCLRTDFKDENSFNQHMQKCGD